MTRALLADTGPLYAAVDRDDAYHVQAQQELERLEREQWVIVVSYSTLLEAHTLIMRRLGLRVAHVWLQEIQRGAVLVTPVADDYSSAVERVQAYQDQALTLCDGVLAALSSRLRHAVWTYDHHFDNLRTPVWR